MKRQSCSSEIFSKNVVNSKIPLRLLSSASLTNTKPKVRVFNSKEPDGREYNFLALDPIYRSKQLKKQRRQDIQKLYHDNKTSSNFNEKGAKIANNKKNKTECKFTFVFDPNGRFSYWMSKSKFIDFLGSKQNTKPLKFKNKNINRR
jgi:hypothetical protein